MMDFFCKSVCVKVWQRVISAMRGNPPLVVSCLTCDRKVEVRPCQAKATLLIRSKIVLL